MIVLQRQRRRRLSYEKRPLFRIRRIKLRDRDAQRLRQFRYGLVRRTVLAIFNAADVTLRQPRFLGQLFLSQSAFLARIADLRADELLPLFEALVGRVVGEIEQSNLRRFLVEDLQHRNLNAALFVETGRFGQRFHEFQQVRSIGLWQMSNAVKNDRDR